MISKQAVPKNREKTHNAMSVVNEAGMTHNWKQLVGLGGNARREVAVLAIDTLFLLGNFKEMGRILAIRLADSRTKESKYIIDYILRKLIEANKFDLIAELTDPGSYEYNLSSDAQKLLRRCARTLLRGSI